MPAIRNLDIRRSRRLSRLPPRAEISNEDYDADEIQLLCAANERPAAGSEQLSSSLAADLPAIDTSEISTTAPPSPAFLALQSSSHSRKKNPDRVPRPANAFMCYRSAFCLKEKQKVDAERDHRRISCIAAQKWRGLSEKQRAPYKLLAEEVKRRHAEKYPGYKFSPGYKKARATVTVRSDRRNPCKPELVSPLLEVESVEPERVERVIKEEMDVDFFAAPVLQSLRPAARQRKGRKQPYKPRRVPKAKAYPPNPVIYEPVFTINQAMPTLDQEELIVDPTVSLAESTVDQAEVDYVPTHEIPPLDLNSSGREPKTELKLEPTFPGKSNAYYHAGFMSKKFMPGPSTMLSRSDERPDVMLSPQPPWYASPLLDPSHPDVASSPQSSWYSSPGTPVFTNLDPFSTLPRAFGEGDDDEYTQMRYQLLCGGRSHDAVDPLDTSGGEFSEWLVDPADL
ncbi:hypothetical protein EUX98_g4011 [Antrodiella citrinella]|uniref:HMG box domain-containing protein n=1 Tax=Antrodiella citrinella TaxID=2447956 RepID=A0A4S4MV43_9APHY|nr:hypothetical protein EUX98_g4011 [Antrodiella citrinella]